MVDPIKYFKNPVTCNFRHPIFALLSNVTLHSHKLEVIQPEQHNTEHVKTVKKIFSVLYLTYMPSYNQAD